MRFYKFASLSISHVMYWSRFSSLLSFYFSIGVSTSSPYLLIFCLSFKGEQLLKVVSDCSGDIIEGTSLSGEKGAGCNENYL